MSSSDAKLEKYRDLYVLSKEVLAEEQQRFHRIDEKALQLGNPVRNLLSKYIGAVEL